MRYFELESADISTLGDGDLRELVGRLSEAEVVQMGHHPKCVTWGGRQEAADGGVDVRVEDAAITPGTGFVPRGSCGFQVKKNAMPQQACRDEMMDAGTLRPVIANLADRNGAYIIVSGKDDCSDSMLKNRRAGMAEAVAMLPSKSALHLDFYGRDQLATWLRQHPGVALWLRSRLGRPLSGWRPFGRWAAAPQEQDDEFLLDDHPCVIDASSSAKDPVSVSEGIQLARERLRQRGRTVRIIGLSGVGKTRFAQALFEADVGEGALPHASAIYADLGEDLTPTASELIEYLIANDLAVHLVLDNCPPDVHRQLQKKVSERAAKLTLLTIEYDISDDRPEETDVIALEPSSQRTVSKLVRKRFSDLGQVNADKIAEFSGGNARIAIALASRVEADETLINFSDEELFHRLFNQRKGVSDTLLRSAEALSLVYSFNASASEFNDELSVLGAIGGVDRQTLYREQVELRRRQLAQQRGDWRAVLPQALANRLAKRALENISPDEINAELLKHENRRLFLSCAHRLGHLHDFEPAARLAKSWVDPGGPLHDIASCEAEVLPALWYIAPIFPATALRLIEAAAAYPTFASRENSNFSSFVSLLCQLAYDENAFDRAVAVLLKFAEGEKAGENSYSIVGSMQQLFSPYLSGTQATPARRQAFIRNLIESGNARHLEVASELLRSALAVTHWTSLTPFDFGARRRDSGWRPRTLDEELDWYQGHLQLLRPSLGTDDPLLREWARSLLCEHFRGLWTSAGCFDTLEDIVRSHAVGGTWPGVWMAIKETLCFDADGTPPERHARLVALERLAAPSDLVSEMKAYVLANTWDHEVSRKEVDPSEANPIATKIVTLGKLAATEPTYLERLGPKLWESRFDALSLFGSGLARGSIDQMATFDLLLEQLQRKPPAQIFPLVLHGYVSAVDDTDPGLSRVMLERVLEHPSLRPHFLYLLGAGKATPWSTGKLLDLATSGAFEVSDFQQISYGRILESIPDRDLAALLAILNEREGGPYTALQVLRMRFAVGKNSGYLPNAELLSVGRRAIRNLLSTDNDHPDLARAKVSKSVVELCLSPSAQRDEVREIVLMLCDGVDAYRFSGFHLEVIVTTLTRNFPEIVLDGVFTGGDREHRLVRHLFRGFLDQSLPSLTSAPDDRLISWCQGDQDRIARLAAAVCPYSIEVAGDTPLAHPKRVVLSKHIKSLLKAAQDKLSIVEIMFSAIQPSSWSGSRAEIVELRSRAFAELRDYPLPEVAELAKQKLAQIEQLVRTYREKEAEEHNRREQRFE